MKEKSLLKIAFLCSLVGIFIILLIAEKNSFAESNIAQIDNATIGHAVDIKGRITSLKETPGLLIFEVRDDTGAITVIAFKEEGMLLKKGGIVGVKGIVKEYAGKLEIEAAEIVLFQ